MRTVLNIVNNAPKPVSAKEQLELLKQYRETGDIEFRNKLIESNYAFLARICYIYASKYVSCYEVFSVGIIGMIEAAEKFDLSRDLKFLSYAVWHVKNRITLFVSENAEGIVRYSVKQHRKNATLARENRHDEINYISYVRQGNGVSENPDWDIFENLAQNTYESPEDAMYMSQVDEEIYGLINVMNDDLGRIAKIKMVCGNTISYEKLGSQLKCSKYKLEDDFDKVRALMKKNPILRDHIKHHAEACQ